jgi:hypothetical protein
MSNPGHFFLPGCSVRFRVMILALMVWLALSLPSIIMTIVLKNTTHVSTEKETGDNVIKEDAAIGADFTCYENFTIYYPIFEEAQFWIEGVLLLVVGICGICGNCLTLVVLSKSKNSSFHQVIILSGQLLIKVSSTLT